MKIKLIKRQKQRRRTVLLILPAFLLVSLTVLASGNDKVTIEFKEAPLEQALKKIGDIYKVAFTYDPSVVKNSEKITLLKKERTLNELLYEISVSTGLKFMQLGNLIGVQKSSSSPSQKNISEDADSRVEDILVKGKVFDTDNKPMQGVSISVKGKSSKGATTNAAGEFSIVVQKGDILIISSVGYESQEILIQDNNLQNIVLRSVERALEDVVVTALGIKKEKRKVAYSIQEVKGTELEKARESNVISNLAGKVAGLSIQTKSTLYENPKVTLRGGSTLVVIDGVPVNTDFWNINPDDIDNINVLKGTAATGLYGSLGINGAIMITTKKGKLGANGIEISFNSTNQFQAGYLRIPETQTEYGMGWAGQYAFEDGKGNGWYDDYGYVYGPKLNQKDPNTASGYVEIPQYNGVYDPNGSYTTTFPNGDQFTGHVIPAPWITRSQSNLKKFLRNEFLTTNNFSIAGKTDRSEYRISLTHLYQMGQVPNTHLNSSTINLAGSLKITEKLKVEGIVSYNKQYTYNYPVTGYGPDNLFYNIVLWMGPEVDINDMRNYWVPGKEGVEQKTYNYTWYNNPWFLAYERLRGYNRDAVVAQANATYDFTKNFSFLVRSGITVNNTGSDIKTPYSFINYGSSRAPFGNYELTRDNQFRIVTDALLTYKKDFLRNFNATVSAGGSTRYEQNTNLYSTTNGLSVPGLYNLGNTINPVLSTNLLREKQVNSVLGYAEIAYKNQVYLNISGRNDWTSSLQKPFNSFFYPSASVGIIASEMFRLPSFISYLKLRASWANISTDNIHISNEIPDEYATHPVYTNEWHQVE